MGVTRMDASREVLVLGIGNLLWADDDFGVRAVEALNQAYRFPEAVELVDGGTLGLNLLAYIESSRRVLVFDAIDFGLAPGELKVLRDSEVPAWGARKLSPHQNGFNDILALAQLHDVIKMIGQHLHADHMRRSDLLLEVELAGAVDDG